MAVTGVPSTLAQIDRALEPHRERLLLIRSKVKVRAESPGFEAARYPKGSGARWQMLAERARRTETGFERLVLDHQLSLGINELHSAGGWKTCSRIVDIYAKHRFLPKRPGDSDQSNEANQAASHCESFSQCRDYVRQKNGSGTRMLG